MRILLDARLYGLEHAGIGRYILNLIKQLKKQDKKNEYVLLLRKKHFNSLKIPLNWKKVLADFQHYTIQEQLQLPRFINKEKPDLVHFPHFNIPIFWKGDFVVTIHDLTMHKQKRDASKLSMPVYSFKRIFYKFVFRKAVLDSKNIIVPSKAVKNELVDYFKIDSNKIVVTYEGISGLKTQKKLPEENILKKYNLVKNNYFFYVGNAYPHKNLERAIKSVLHLNKENKRRIKFAIASSRDIFTKRLKKTINKLKAKNEVKLLGFVPDNELKTLYKNSIAFVYPSLSEGFGLQGLEAMEAGTLVLASSIPVFKEIYKENALFFNPVNVQSISQAMDKVLKMGTESRIEMISKAKKLAKQYSWGKMAKDTLQVYNKAVL